MRPPVLIILTLAASCLAQEQPPTLVISPSATPPASVGESYSVTLTATPTVYGSGNYLWTISGGSLPPGLNGGLVPTSSGTGFAIGGTPGAPGVYGFQVMVQDAYFEGLSGVADFSIAIPDIANGSTLPGAVAGVPYSVQFATLYLPGPFTYSAAGATGGLVFVGDTLTGTPTSAGTLTFTVTAQGSGAFATKNFSITVLPLPAVATSATLPTAVVGTPYKTIVTASGGLAPFQFGVAYGLPPGLTIDQGGTISGTPLTVGSYQFRLYVLDANGTTGSQDLTIVVVNGVTVTTGSPLIAAIEGTAYAQAIVAAGGTSPYTFTSAGTLPPGLKIDSSGNVTGIPSASGLYSFTITATDSQKASGAKAYQLAVTNSGPAVQALPPTLNFTTPAGGDPTASQSLVVQSRMGVAAAVGIVLVDDGSSGPSNAASRAAAGATGPAWLAVRPSAGVVTPAVLDVTADAGSLAAGTYSARIRLVVGSDPPVDVPVKFTVATAPSELQVLPGFLRFYDRFSTPGIQEQDLFVRNSGGGGAIAYQAAVVGANPGVTLIGSAGRTAPGVPGVVGIQIDTHGMNAGGSRFLVRVTSGASSVDVSVTVFVAPDGPSVRLESTGLRMVVRQGNTQSARVSTRLISTGTPASPVTFSTSITGRPDLIAITASGNSVTSSTPATLAFAPTANADAAPPGTYYALVQVTESSSRAPEFLVVVLTVVDATTPASLDVSPTGLVFVARAGSLRPAAQQIAIATNASSGAFVLSSHVNATGTWLSASPASGTTSAQTPGSAAISVDATGLRGGVYTGEVDVAIGSAQRGVAITLIVAPGASAAAARSSDSPRAAAGCAPTQVVMTPVGLPVNFSVPAAWPSTLAVQLYDDCGSPIVGAGGSVAVRFDNGDVPLSLNDLQQDGYYAATWTPQHAATPVGITVTASSGSLPIASVQIPGGVDANPLAPPVLFRNGTVSSADSPDGATVAPGTLSSLYGLNLAAGSVTIASVPAPTQFNGTVVNVAGLAAPLFFLSGGQLNLQAPSELTFVRAPLPVVLVTSSGIAVLPAGLIVVAAAPAVLATPDGFAEAQHADGTPIDEAHAAKPGEKISVFLAGMGATQPPVGSGQASPANPRATVTIPTSVTLDGQSITPDFAGLTGGRIGIYQIDFTVPSGARSGDLDFVVTQNGISSNTAKVPVRP